MSDAPSFVRVENGAEASEFPPLPVSNVKATVGAVLSISTVPETAWVAALPALSEMSPSQR